MKAISHSPGKISRRSHGDALQLSVATIALLAVTASAANTPRISFKIMKSGKSLTININTGSYEITTAGSGNLDRSIYRYSQYDPVLIVGTGNIT